MYVDTFAYIQTKYNNRKNNAQNKQVEKEQEVSSEREREQEGHIDRTETKSCGSLCHTSIHLH